MPDHPTGRQCQLCRCFYYDGLHLDLCGDCREWEASHSGDLGDLLGVGFNQEGASNR